MSFYSATLEFKPLTMVMLQMVLLKNAAQIQLHIEAYTIYIERWDLWTF